MRYIETIKTKLAYEIKNENQNIEIVVFEQTKNGKANAVWEGIKQ